MSVKVLSWVLDHSRTEDAVDQLVLLVIANYANDDGSGAFPSLPTIARCSKLSERTVRRAIRRLERAGDLLIESGGGSRSHRYVVCTTPVDACGPRTQRPPGHSDRGSQRPVTPDAVSASPGHSVHRSINKPSFTRHDRRARTPVREARGAGNRGGVGAGTFPANHMDHIACGPVCFTPRMMAKYIGRFGGDVDRLRTWARAVCQREQERLDAGGHPPGYGDDFDYWTAAYNAEFGERRSGEDRREGRHVPDAEATDRYLAEFRAHKAAVIAEREAKKAANG